MPLDLGPPQKIWMPAKPAIIRAASLKEIERARRKANFLPGMAGVAGMKSSAAPAAPSFTFVASGSGSDPSIELPGTPTAGDLCVIWSFYQWADTLAGGTPADFTRLGNNIGVSGHFSEIAAKILVGGETTVTGYNADIDESWIAATFHPSSPITGFAWNSPNEQGTTGNPSAQTITAATPPIILLGAMGSSGTINPRTTDPTMDELTSGSDHFGHYFIYNPGDTPVNHSYDMDDEGSNLLQSGYLTFT